MNDTSRDQQKNCSWYWWTGMVVTGIVVLLFLVITFVPPGDPATSGLYVHVVDTDVTSRITGNSSEGRGKMRTQFLGGRIVMIYHSQHLLLRRTARQLQQKLQGASDIESVRLYGPETVPLSFDQSPDLFLHLTLDSFDTSGWLWFGRQMDVDLSLSLGTHYRMSHHYKTDPWSPTVDAFYRADAEATLNSTGYATAGAQYKKEADQVSDVLMKRVRNKVNEWRSDWNQLANRPDDFYPEYRTVSNKMPLPSNGRIRKRFEAAGFLVNNTTTWNWITRHPARHLREMQEQLEERHWDVKISRFNPSSSQPVLMTARNGRLEYRIFSIDSGNHMGGNGPSGSLVIRYKEYMKNKRIRQNLQRRLSSENTSIPLMVMLSRYMNKKQKAQLAHEIERSTGRSVQGEYWLAKYMLHNGDRQTAKTHLWTAYRIEKLEDTPTHLQQLNEMGEQLSEGADWDPVRATEAKLKQAGFRRVTVGETVSASMASERGFLFFYRVEPGEYEVCRLRISSCFDQNDVQLHLSVDGTFHSYKSLRSRKPEREAHMTRQIQGHRIHLRVRRLEQNQFRISIHHSTE